jgi:hypothetical protein
MQMMHSILSAAEIIEEEGKGETVAATGAGSTIWLEEGFDVGGTTEGGARGFDGFCLFFFPGLTEEEEEQGRTMTVEEEGAAEAAEAAAADSLVESSPRPLRRRM